MKPVALLVFFAFMLLAIQGTTQNNIQNPTAVTKCYTVEEMKELRKRNPGIESDQQFEAWIKPLTERRKAGASLRTAPIHYTLPIVFHVIYWGGDAEGSGSNVSKSLVESQLFQLNKDFSNLSNSPYAVSADARMQFKLAQKSPGGNVLVQPGIDRINASAKGWFASTWSPSFITNTIKPKTIWDPTKYLNVWIIRMSAGILGYATFPSGSTLTGLDDTETDSTAGVVIAPLTVGSVTNPYGGCSTNQYNLGKTLTHELGHFFGLRHIWGDASCGTDYCDDTPLHQSPNAGVPVHPKRNICGTTDEMFENYMDYSDDQSMNTFTGDQVNRMRTVLLNSPRRKELQQSDVGLVGLAGNKIFLNAGNSCSGDIIVSEKGTTTSFPWYRDIPVIINVENMATGSATVMVSATGTATANSDFKILNPTVNFLEGDGFKVITVRVLDDGIPEPKETITLTYTINGTGLSVAATNQTFNITIIDDDEVYPGQRTVTLISENFETPGGLLPPRWTPFSASAGKNTFVVSNNGSAGGSNQCLHITNDAVSKPAAYTKTTAASAALRTPLIDATGLTNLNWKFKYRVGGELVNGYKDYGWAAFSTESASTNFNQLPGSLLMASNSVTTGTSYLSLPETFNNTKFYLAYYWTNDNTGGNDPGFNIDDVVVTAEPVRIDTIANTNNTWAIPANTITNFKSIQNEQLIATIKNADKNVSALTVSIAEAGTDRPYITIANTTIKRSRKVISLSSNITDTTTHYQATFYFTADEMAAWGTTPSGLKFLKIKEPVDLAQSMTAGDAMIVTPTKVEDKLATDGYIAFTGDFTGFAKFVLVEASAALPLSWLSFTGTLNTNKTNLKWSTSAEHNNKGFDVQRSTDGNNFTSIGWVRGLNGISNNYTLEDASIKKGSRYFYRLKQIDNNNRQSYSSVINVMWLNADEANVYPNPFKDKLVLRKNGSAEPTAVLVTDATGRILFKSPSLSAIKAELSTSTWNAGIYVVQIQNERETKIFKVVKQ
jgi:zinc-dependent metalloproteinase lipoprotein